MKIYKITLFILLCTAAVTLIAFVFPREGVRIGSTKLNYANVDKFLYPTKVVINIHHSTQAIADANNIRQHIANKGGNKYIARRLEFINHPYAIDMPEDNIKWLDSAFMTMQQSENKTVRIVHYGDSQIEEDRMTSTIRCRMQSLFGGFGVGLLPAFQPIPSSAISQNSYGTYKRNVVFGPETMHHKDKHYGPTGQMIRSNNKYTTTFIPINLKATKENTKKFRTVSVLYGNNTTPISISIEAGEYTDTISISDSVGTLQFATFHLPSISRKASICINGDCNIYGYILDGNNHGLQVDNIPMRGCSGTVFTRMSAESLSPLFRKYATPLIIMQYGGNSVPYLEDNKSIGKYCKNIEYQINYIKHLNPKGKILFIGPSDMGTSIDGTMQTFPSLPTIVDSLRQTCLRSDVAYWDLYAAMGGKNSMTTWVNSTPALAGSDYIHFTTLGSQTAANMLCDYIEELYEYYIERTNPKEENLNSAVITVQTPLTTDTTNIVN